MSGPRRVSIVINSYNYAEYLRAAIDSALQQTYGHVEVVVVDDGSTDRSPALIAEYKDRVVARFQRNAGQAAAFNAGFAASTGDIIMFLDADDLLRPDAAARIAAAWQPSTVKLHFRLQIVDETGQPQDGCNPDARFRLPRGDLKDLVLTRGFYVTPPTSGNAFSRAVLQKLLPMPTTDWRIAADTFLLFLSPLYGSLQAIEDCLGYYRVHNHNQWNDTKFDLDRIVLQLEYQEKKAAAIQDHAEALGLEAGGELLLQDPFYIDGCMTVALCDPTKLPTSRSLSVGTLSRKGVRASWRFAPASRRWRALNMVWFAALGAMPAPAAKRIIGWRRYQHTRPALVDFFVRHT